MIRTILRTAVLVGLTSSLAHAASYLIELTDGREYVISHYWVERDEIHFYICDGVLGIPQEDVKRIRRISERERAGHAGANLCGPAPEKAKEGPGDREAEAAPAEKAQAEPTPASASYTRFEAAVKTFEGQLGGITRMSGQELLSLAAHGETLKKQMLADPDVQELRPLINKVYEAIAKIAEAVSRTD